MYQILLIISIKAAAFAQTPSIKLVTVTEILKSAYKI